MKRTPLYERHTALGAKMAPFAGYEMPIQYKKGIIFEHNATRHSATIFDTCHMGEFSIVGPAAVADLEKVLSCQVNTLKTGQCRYGFICNETGGVIDDQILYRKGEQEFFMVVNASTEESDFAWITSHFSPGTVAVNLSAETAKIDLQGPDAPKIAAALFDGSFASLKYYHFMECVYNGEKVLLSRTGYTGELGFELYSSVATALRFWDDCIAHGAEPAGLGCRDTLRLEMGFPLYGHELNAETDASWSGFTKAIAAKPFIGASSLGKRPGAQSALCGLLIDGRRTAHPGNRVADHAGNDVGYITSGSFSPTLGQAIALGYCEKGGCSEGTQLTVDTGRGILAATVSALPFYKGATGRNKIENYFS